MVVQWRPIVWAQACLAYCQRPHEVFFLKKTITSGTVPRVFWHLLATDLNVSINVLEEDANIFASVLKDVTLLTLLITGIWINVEDELVP